MSTPFTLALCAELLFTELPLADRLRHVRDLGFSAEIWNWANHDADVLAAAVADGVRIESMTGYLRGTFGDAEGAAELVRTARESAQAATRIGVPRLNLHGTGLDGRGHPIVALPPGATATGAMWARAALTLSEIARIGAEFGLVFELENLNLRVDHPGMPFASVDDCLALVEAVDSPHLRLNLDLYHAQVDSGNLVETCLRALPVVGEIQVADVPGRCEPGTGEIAYPAVARALADAGYTGVVAYEGHPSGDSTAAAEAFRAAFTV